MISFHNLHAPPAQDVPAAPLDRLLTRRTDCLRCVEPATFESAPLSPASRAALEDLAFRYGQSYESYLVTEPDRHCFFMAERLGAVAFLRRDRYLHVGGGLLADAADRPALLDSFADWARQHKFRLMFYNVGPQDLSLFRAAGFQVTKWGEEPIIDLRDLTWAGRKFEWVRRQTNYAIRQGLEFSECHPDRLAPPVWDQLARELVEISDSVLAERPQVGDIGFLNGRFDPACIGRRRLFIARHARLERVEGFLMCNPCRGGNEWALELYRDRPDAVRGTIPFLMHQALRQFQQEGIERASLCLVPAMRCNRPLAGDSPLIRRAMTVSRYFGFIFDVAGLYHYKSRFRPRFEDRFICAAPPVTLGAACSFVGLCGAMRLNPVKLARRLWRQCTRAGARSTLASPEAEACSANPPRPGC